MQQTVQTVDKLVLYRNQIDIIDQKIIQSLAKNIQQIQSGKSLFAHFDQYKALNETLLMAIQNVLSQNSLPLTVINSCIITALLQRFAVVQQVGEYKKTHRLSPLQPQRWQQILQNRMQLAETYHLNPDLIREIWECFHTYALRLEEVCINTK